VCDGRLVPLPDPETRWWFATEHPVLQEALGRAIRDEDLRRSLVFSPDVFFEHPPTDGGFFHLEGVPLVNFLPAPRYLLDGEDTVEFVHQPSLVPVTRAVASIIGGLEGLGPQALRRP
jgi:hypothetical protein